MPNSQILRVGNFVAINDVQSPYYGETGPISDYDKATNMVTVDISFAGKNFQWKVNPCFVALTGSQPIYTAVHQFDQVVVVNIMSPMYSLTGQVIALTPRAGGLEVKVKETHTGTVLHFWAVELSPVQTIQTTLASGNGIASTRPQQPTQAGPKYTKGDWVEIVNQQSQYHRLIGQVLDILKNGNLLLDFGGPSAVEVSPSDCKMYSPAINKTAIAQAQVHPWASSPYDGSGSGSPEPDESESDSYGVGQPKEKVFDHASLGTDLSGDELMKSIRDICGGH